MASRLLNIERILKPRSWYSSLQDCHLAGDHGQQATQCILRSHGPLWTSISSSCLRPDMIVRSLSYEKIWCQAYICNEVLLFWTLSQFCNLVLFIQGFLMPDIQVLIFRFGYSGPDIQVWIFRSWNSGLDIQVLKFRSCYLRPAIHVLIFRSCYSDPNIHVLTSWSWHLGPDIQSWNSGPVIQILI